MLATNPLPARQDLQSLATGQVMMAGFTMFWAGIAFGALDFNVVGISILLFFALFSGAFCISASGLHKAAKDLPPINDEAHLAEDKKAGKKFGIIVGAEGLGIFIAINIVNNIGHRELDVPVIALVVGLHFFALAKVFKRSQDYYLASWSTTVAILGIFFSLKDVMPHNMVLVFIGIGMAIATSCYGTLMMYKAKRYKLS